MPRPGELVQVAGPIWLLPGEGGGRFPRSHSVLVQDPEACAIVDTGCGIQLLGELRRRLRVDLVLNTHAHPDHTAGNHLFADLPIRVPQQAAATAGNLLALSERFFDDPPLRPRWRAWVQQEMGFVDQPPTGTFVAGEELAVGRARLTVIPTPGHTADHCCLYCAEHGVLIAADIDLTPFGPWYGHPESSLDALRRSIDRVRALRPRAVVSAHRPPVTGEREVQRALDRFASVLAERERRLLALLARPCALAQIVDAAPIYGRFAYAPELMRYWEEQMVREHLTELLARGAVEQAADGFVARG